MRLIGTLFFATLRDRWIPLTLVGLAITAATALIAVVGGVYGLTGARAQKTVKEVVGPIDRILMSGSREDWEAERSRYGMIPPGEALPESLYADLEKHPAVKASCEVAYAKVEVFDAKQMYSGSMYRPGYSLPLPIMAMKDDAMPPEWLLHGITPEQWKQAIEQGTLIFPKTRSFFGGPTRSKPSKEKESLNRNRPPQDLAKTKGNKKQSDKPRAAGPQQGGARYSTGSEVLVTSENGGQHATVGPTYEPPGQVRNFGGIFVSTAQFEKLVGTPFRINRVFFDLDNKAKQSLDDFDESFNQAASKLKTPFCMVSPQDYLDEMAEANLFSGFGIFPFIGTVLTILGAFFIILFAMSVGNRRRMRDVISLRAMGVPSWPLGILALLESTLPAILGCLGGLLIAGIMYFLGVQGGRGGLRLAGNEGFAMAVYLRTLMAIAPLCFVVALSSAILGTLPIAVKIWKSHPLETSGSSRDPMSTDARHAICRIVIAILLVAINPILVLTPMIPEELRPIVIPLSYIFTLTGILLLVPWCFHVIQRLCTGFLSAICLVRGQLITDFSAQTRKNSAGTSAMVIALGLFIAIYVWGQSMQVPFLLSQRRPDLSAIIAPNGLPEKAIEELQHHPAIERLVPMRLEHPTVSDQMAKSVKMLHGNWRDLIYLGVDVSSLFDSEKGIIGADFLRGEPKQAFADVMQGDACLITAELYRMTPERFDVGNEIEIQSLNDHRVVKRKIAGVIDLPGWHLMTKSTRMRRGLGRVAGLVFVSPKTALQDYPESLPRAFCMNVDPSKLDAKNENATTEKEVQTLFEDAIAQSSPDSKDRSYLRVVSFDEMTKMIQQRCNYVIAGIAKVPFYALLLASLVVAATVAASLQARYREIGILRSLGMSRTQIFRLILIQGIFMSLVACMLGTIFGIMVAWSGVQISGPGWGVAPPFIVPWKMVGLGCLVTVGACFFGTFFPALYAASAAPYRLLKAAEE